MSSIDDINIRRLLLHARKEIETIIHSHWGLPNTEDTREAIQSKISQALSRPEFAEQFDTAKTKIYSPEYIDDNDIHTTSSYEEYCIRKDMKGKAKITLQEYRSQLGMNPYDMKLDIQLKSQKPVKMTKISFTAKLT